MRISTTALFLTGALLLLSAITVLALPVVGIANQVNACGGSPNGSFTVNITNASPGATNQSLRYSVFGPPGFTPIINQTVPGPAPASFSFNVIGAVGDNGVQYLIVVSDGTGNQPFAFFLYDYTVELDAANTSDNTNSNCTPSNGKISVTLDPTIDPNTINYSWTGPNGFTSNSQNLTGLSGGDYNLSYNDGTGGGCTLGPVHINDPIFADFSISGPASICAGNGATVTVSATTAGYTYDVIDADAGNAVIATAIGDGSANFPISIAVAQLPTGAHHLTVNAHKGACTPKVDTNGTIVINVNPTPTYTTGTVPAHVCSNSTLGVSLSTFKAGGTDATSFKLTAISNGSMTAVSGVSTAPATIAVNDLADDVWRNVQATAQDVTYTLTPTIGTCDGASFSVTIHIDPQPDFNNNQSTTVCSGQAVNVDLVSLQKTGTVNASTYNISVNSNGLTLVGGGPVSNGNGFASTVIKDDQWLNTSNAQVDVVYSVVPVSAAGCKGDSFNFTAHITPQPAYTSFTASAVCSQTAIGVDLTGKENSGSLAATSFSVTGINPNAATLVSGSPPIASAPFTITATDLSDDKWKNTTATSTNVVYTIQPIRGSCTGASFTVTVPITPEPVYTTPGTSVQVCSNVAIGVDLQAFLTGPLAADGYDITQIQPDAGLTAKSVNLTLPHSGDRNVVKNDVWENLGNGSLNVIYTVVPKNGTCVGQQFTFTVQIKPEPNISDYTAPANVCTGDVLGIDLSTLPTNNIAPDAWTIASIDAVNLTAGAGPGSGTGKDLIKNDKWINNTSGTLPVVYHLTPSVNGCSGKTFKVTINIAPRPTYNSLPNNPTGICAVQLGIDLTTLKATGSPDATGFNLQSIVTSDPAVIQSGGGPTVNGPIGATDLADDIWSNPTSTNQTVVYTIVPTNGGCDGAQFTVTFTIKPQPAYSSDTPTVCSDIDLNYDLTSRKAATSSSADQFKIDAVTPDPGLVNKATSPVVAGTTTTNTTLSDKWQNISAGPLTVVYKITPSVAGCAGAQFTLTFTINPEPAYTGKTLPDICSEDAVGIDLETLNSGTSVTATTFDYTVSAPGLTAIGTTNPASGTGDHNVIANDQWKNVTNGVLPVTYTITPKSVNGCKGATFTVKVNITPQPDYSGTTVNNICGETQIGVDLATLINSGSIVADSFEIVSLTNNNLTPGTTVQTTGSVAPGDLIDDTFKNVSGATQQAVYKLRPVKGTCKGDQFTITVNILPQPDYQPTASKAVCSQEALGIDLSSFDTGNSIVADSYTISITFDNTLLTSVGSSLNTGAGQDKNSISGHKFKNVTGSTQQVKYTIVPVGGGCAGDPTVITVDVKSEPVGLDDKTTICSGTAVNYDLQNNIVTQGNGMTGVSFSWQATADNTNITGESLTAQNTSVINDNLVNTTSTDQIVNYAITPGNGTCSGAVFNLQVTIVAKPVLADNQTATVCSGTAINYRILLTPPNTPAATTFTWPAPVMSDGSTQGSAQTTQLPLGGSTVVHIVDVLTNTGTTPITATYTVTPSIGGTCAGTAKDIVITINPGFIANAGNDQAICSDAGPYQLVGSSVSGAATTGKWTLTTNPGDGAIDIEGQFVSDPSVAKFTATVPGDYVLTLVTEDDPSGVCNPGQDQVTITVTDKPVITPNQNPLVCANDPVNYEILMTPANLPANTVFNWADPDGPTGATNASAGVNVAMGPAGTKHINDILRNTTNANIDVIYQVTPSVGLCVGAQTDVKVTVKPAPSVVFGQTKTICSGDQVNYEILLNPANTPSGTTFSWPDPDGAGSGKSKLNIAADPAGTLHITDTLYNGTGAANTVVYSVIARGTNGCLAITRDVTITVNPGAVVEAGNAQIICSSGTATLSGSSIGGLATQGTWTIVSNPSAGDGVITNGTNTATPSAATFTATVAGNYKLRLTTDDPSGSCSAVSDDVVITIRPVGDPTCTGGTGTPAFACSDIVPVTSNSTCNNSDGAVQFNITFHAAVIGDIKITIDGPVQRVNYASIDGFNFASLASGSYTYLVEYNGLSCPGTFSIDRSGTVGVPTATLVTSPNCLSDTGTAIIDAPNETGISLEWSADGSTWTSFLGGAPVTGLPSGSNMIFVRRPGDPCAGGVVVAFPATTDIPVTFTPGNATCSGSDGSITVANNAPGPYTYQLNGTTTILPADNVFRDLVADTYSIIVADSKGCTKTYNSIIVGQVVGPNSLDTLYVKKSVSVPDLASGSALVGVKPSGLEPYETKLELTTPLFASQSYLSDWKEVPLDPQNLKFEQSYTNIFAGIYTLGLRDAGGCTKMYVFTIDVNTDLFIPNIFTPNHDGSNEVFFIRNLPSTDAKVLITDRWGKEVYKSSSYQNDWDGGSITDGMYYYTVKIGGQKYSGWLEILRGQ